jgi:transposase
MTPRKHKAFRFRRVAEPLQVVHPDAAAVDVGSAEHWVAVPPDRDPEPVRRFAGGKILSRRTRPGSSRAAQALRLAARPLHHAKSALGAWFRRLKSRLGAPKATTAAAHKLARLVYRLLKHGEAYVAQSQEAYEQRYREQRLRTLSRQARELGCQVVPATP